MVEGRRIQSVIMNMKLRKGDSGLKVSDENENERASPNRSYLDNETENNWLT